MKEGRAWVHTCRPYAGHVYLCVSQKIQSSKSQGKLVGKTRLPASSDLTEKEKTGKEKTKRKLNL
jgi:hypothetical protein